MIEGNNIWFAVGAILVISGFICTIWILTGLSKTISTTFHILILVAFLAGFVGGAMMGRDKGKKDFIGLPAPLEKIETGEYIYMNPGPNNTNALIRDFKQEDSRLVQGIPQMTYGAHFFIIKDGHGKKVVTVKK